MSVFLCKILTDGLLCGSQVYINPAETKDGSGGPLSFEDLEFGDKDFQRGPDPVDLPRTRMEPRDAISVRRWTHCAALSATAGCSFLQGES